MRVLMVVLLSGLSMSACGGSEDVLWSCTCSATCDGGYASQTSSGCGTQEDAQTVVDASVAECQADLADACEAYSCTCECQPSETACTPTE